MRGRGYFVDVNSLRERESFRYFNLDIRYLGKYGVASRYEDFDGNGWTVDCDNYLIGRDTPRGLWDAKLVEVEIASGGWIKLGSQSEPRNQNILYVYI